MFETVHAQELIPCSDGSYADPAIGCVEAPAATVSTESNLAELILVVASYLTTVVAAAALIALITGGVLYSLALGEEEKLQKAKRTMLYSLVGLVIALMARFIVQAVLAGIQI